MFVCRRSCYLVTEETGVAPSKNISLTNWEDISSRRTGNPLAEDEILRLARDGELLVEAQSRVYVPLDVGGKWELIEGLTERDVAQWLHTQPSETHWLLLAANWS
jgi:hypothetical protein